MEQMGGITTIATHVLAFLTIRDVPMVASACRLSRLAANHDGFWIALLQRAIFTPHLALGYGACRGSDVIAAWADFSVETMSVKCLKEELTRRRISLAGLVEKNDLRKRLREARQNSDAPPLRHESDEQSRIGAGGGAAGGGGGIIAEQIANI